MGLEITGHGEARRERAGSSIVGTGVPGRQSKRIQRAAGHGRESVLEKMVRAAQRAWLDGRCLCRCLPLLAD